MTLKFSNLTSAELSDIGRRRTNNEDSVLRVSSHGVFCVADGMGGAEGGEVASAAVVQSLSQALARSPGGAVPRGRSRARLVRSAIDKASRWIRRKADETGARGMGSTVVILSFNPDKDDSASAFYAGDSRAYRFRDNALQRLTKDHSGAAAVGIEDESEIPIVLRGVVTRAVGVNAKVDLDEVPVDVVPGDLFMLCSDGLTGMVSDDDLAGLIREHGVDDIAGLAQVLVDRANAAGGHDNISLVLVLVGERAGKEKERETGSDELMQGPPSTASTASWDPRSI